MERLEKAYAGLDINGRVFFGYTVAATAVAVALRVLYLSLYGEPVPPICDAMGYYHMGSYLAEGFGYVWWSDMLFHGQSTPTAAYPPLYPTLVALLRLVGLQSIEVQRYAVAVLGAINVPILALAGRRLAGPITGGIAATLAAVSPAMIAIDGSFMTEALYLTLVSAVLFVILKVDIRLNSRSWGLVGFLLGLASLTRSEGVILLGLMVFPAVFALGHGQSWARIAKPVMAVAIGFAVIVGPWTIRNAVQFGAFIPISQSYKGVLAGANCDIAYDVPSELGGWLFGCVRAVDVKGLNEVETFEAFRATGSKYALDHRQEWPRVIEARILRTWGLFRRGHWFGKGAFELRSVEFAKQTMWTGWLLIAIAPVGLVLVTRRSRVRGWILFAPIITVTLTSAIAYGNPRFRAAAEPCLILLAAVTCSTLWQTVRQRIANRAGETQKSLV